jgi:chromosome segregation ATPase
MRRRSRLAVTFVALLTVGWSVVSAQPSGSALAADPEAELARTRAQLAEARSAQQSLAATLDQQRAKLVQLQRRSADLDAQLDLAEAELNEVTAE